MSIQSQFESISKSGSGVIVAIHPSDMMDYMKPKKAHDSEQKAFINSFALKRTYAKKLNRESAQEAKEHIMRQQLFLNVMQHKKSTQAVSEQNIDAFYRQAMKDGKPIHRDPVPKSFSQAKFGARPIQNKLDPALK